MNPDVVCTRAVARRAHRVLRILRCEFPLPEWSDRLVGPFSTLIRTVLSQATNDKNSGRAFRNLGKKFEITPKVLAEADAKDIEEAIRIGGLHHTKSRVIKGLSCLIQKRYHGSLDFVRSLPFGEARKCLVSLPGVGPKTADVVLLFSAGKPVLPVDTHVDRVSKRLGMVESNADYERTRLALESLYPPEDRLAAHLLFIELGRKYCKARNPAHDSCPMKSLCPSSP